MLRSQHPHESNVVVCKSTALREVRGRNAFEQLVRYFRPVEEMVPSACYVKGRLQPTRSFGDFHLKKKEASHDHESGVSFIARPHSFPYITATPEVKEIVRHPSDEFIVAGSDGLWDFISPDEAVRFVRRKLVASSNDVEGAEPRDVANALVQEVLNRAASSAKMSQERLRSLNLGERRSFHDDITVAIVRLV
eukprot:TRINITY_DN178542_c0_g1_i1.p1 TRINITY_DN178542_c0_g1~~TRINITY_DN178542_c0_g1_i1.p1  ORF type:complete len:193 (-),score=10.07 TRINITY_DN178542_c0_g1_i1:49-627(-)